METRIPKPKGRFDPRRVNRVNSGRTPSGTLADIHGEAQ
jgi:hypothetical protein